MRILIGYSCYSRDAGSVVAKMNVLFDRDTYEKGYGDMMDKQAKDVAVADKLTQEDMVEGKIVKRAIRDSLATGKVGALTVDPNYLDFNAVEGEAEFNVVWSLGC